VTNEPHGGARRAIREGASAALQPVEAERSPAAVVWSFRGGSVKRSPLVRRTPLRSRGGSRFPHRRDPAFMAWMLVQVQNGERCEVDSADCDYWPSGQAERVHLDAKGSGGDDKGNCCLLCHKHHGLQEKRTAWFERRFKINLRARARRWAERYDNGGEDFAA